MYRNISLAVIILIANCNNTKSVFIQEPNNVDKNTYEDYIYMIRSTHALKKRDVYSIEAASGTSNMQPKEETIIILPSSGVNNNPYKSYYPTNPISRYGGNTGTTVIVSNPDGNNYNTGYGGKYLPNKYG